MHAPQDLPAIEAQAMKSKTRGEKRGKVDRSREPPERADEMAGAEAEAADPDLDSGDDDDPDEADLHHTDDRLWDVFILDDDGEPLPDYGDFWFPD